MTHHRAGSAPFIGALIVAITFAACTGPANARGGGHGFSHGLGRGSGRGGGLAGGRGHGNDAYARAALQEEEKLMLKLKNICRGC
jgi:hypothetical protein